MPRGYDMLWLATGSLGLAKAVQASARLFLKNSAQIRTCKTSWTTRTSIKRRRTTNGPWAPPEIQYLRMKRKTQNWSLWVHPCWALQGNHQAYLRPARQTLLSSSTVPNLNVTKATWLSIWQSCHGLPKHSGCLEPWPPASKHHQKSLWTKTFLRKFPPKVLLDMDTFVIYSPKKWSSECCTGFDQNNN